MKGLIIINKVPNFVLTMYTKSKVVRLTSQSIFIVTFMMTCPVVKEYLSNYML